MRGMYTGGAPTYTPAIPTCGGGHNLSKRQATIPILASAPACCTLRSVALATLVRPGGR